MFFAKIAAKVAKVCDNIGKPRFFFNISLDKSKFSRKIDDETAEPMAIFQEMLRISATSADFVQNFALFTKKPRKIQLKLLNPADFERFLDFFSADPQRILAKTPDLLNNAETHVRNLQKTAKNGSISRITVKLALLLSRLHRGSQAFFAETADFLEFSQISAEDLQALYTESRFLSENWRKSLENAVFSQEILDKLCASAVVDALFAAASANSLENAAYLRGFTRIDGYIGANSREILNLLWVFAYFSLRFPENRDKIPDSWLNSLVKQLNLLDSPRKLQTNRYKRHEIALFLQKFRENVYKAAWIRNYEISAADFAGAKDSKLSLLQKDVEIILKLLRIPYKTEEKVLEIYALDFYLPQKNVYLEVHGPLHYTACKIVDGRTFLKKKLLNSWGLRIVEVGFEEWYFLRGVSAKMAFLIKKIHFLE